MTDIPAHPGRVGADDQQGSVGSGVAVPGPCRQHDHIPGEKLKASAERAAEDHVRAARGDAEHLMGGRVEMVKVVDPVTPCAAPSVVGEQLLVGGGAASRSTAPR
jgi:hypothetical protein